MLHAATLPDIGQTGSMALPILRQHLPHWIHNLNTIILQPHANKNVLAIVTVHYNWTTCPTCPSLVAMHGAKMHLWFANLGRIMGGSNHHTYGCWCEKYLQIVSARQSLWGLTFDSLWSQSSQNAHPEQDSVQLASSICIFYNKKINRVSC